MAFFQNDPPSREPFLNAPPTVLWLIGVLLATHMLRVLLPGTLPDDIIHDYAFTPANYAAAFAHGLPLGGMISLAIPLIAYMFLHGDLTHVGVNSLWLLVFGPIVARRLGTSRFLMFFLFCGIVAALVHLAVYWESPVAVVGASGGVSGLMGAGMRILYGRAYGGTDALAPIFSKRMLGFSLVWMIVNIVSGVFRIGLTDEFALVAWVAHLGGYFAGLAAIGAFDRIPLGKRGLRSA